MSMFIAYYIKWNTKWIHFRRKTKKSKTSNAKTIKSPGNVYVVGRIYRINHKFNAHVFFSVCKWLKNDNTQNWTMINALRNSIRCRMNQMTWKVKRIWSEVHIQKIPQIFSVFKGYSSFSESKIDKTFKNFLFCQHFSTKSAINRLITNNQSGFLNGTS